MKKFLPTSTTLSVNKTKGFTLIELLVVVAIIAILAIVGITLFTSTQRNARDSKRIQDIISMSKAMEVNYLVGTGYKTSIDPTWFADQVMPSNPSPGGAAYATNPMTASAYTFCATLETSIGNATSLAGAGMGTTAGGYFCRKNNQ